MTPKRIDLGELTEAELTGLRWMVSCNGDRVGYLGPTVARTGALIEYARIVESGLCEVRHSLCRRHSGAGYWITEAGRKALSPSIKETGG